MKKKYVQLKIVQLSNYLTPTQQLDIACGCISGRGGGVGAGGGGVERLKTWGVLHYMSTRENMACEINIT